MGRSKTKSRKNYIFNCWCEEFSTLRRVNDKKIHVEAEGNQYAGGDDPGNLFFDSADTTARLEVEFLERFCKGTMFADIKGAEGSAGCLRTWWIDDRNNFWDEGAKRPYENPMTTTGALRALEQRRFNHEILPDAARRLIYVSDLNPACIHALAATVSSLQVPTLRNAIYKYLTFQPSIAVTIRSKGYLTFQLELHLPLFILRKSTSPDKAHDKSKKKPDRGWTDLSFLNLDTFESDSNPSDKDAVWGLQEAQISCVITGTDDWRWVGYGFVDAEVDGDLNDPASCMEFDQIAAEEMEAKFPIWKPRDYWVKVFEIRIGKVRVEYEYLIRTLEFAVKKYMADHPSSLSWRPDTTQDPTAEMKAAFDWAIKMKGLLREPQDVLLATLNAWRAFISEDGGIEYFDEQSATKSIKSRHHSMKNIRKTFRQLEAYHDAIVALIKKCSDYQEHLKLRFPLDKKAAADKNEFISILTLMFLYPVALAAAIFSMQQEAIPFKLSPRSFALTVVILIVIIYVTQIFGTHTLPWLRKRVVRCIGKALSKDISKIEEENFKDPHDKLDRSGEGDSKALEEGLYRAIDKGTREARTTNG